MPPKPETTMAPVDVDVAFAVEFAIIWPRLVVVPATLSNPPM